jgi:hypothetical protein
VALVAAASSASARTVHRISIDVRGPIALVEVERPLSFGAEYGRAASDEVVIDLDLPEGAQLTAAELQAGPRPRRLGSPAAGTDASKAYTEAMRAAGWRSAKAPVDEGVDLRVRVAAPELGQGEQAASWSLRYRFVAPLQCRGGRLVLAMPGSLDPAPSDAEVDLKLALGSGARRPSVELAGAAIRSGGTGRIRASVSVRRAWELSLALPENGSPLGTLLAAGGPTQGVEGALAVTICRSGEDVLAPPSSRLMVLIDRSRSVGPGNAAVARDLARALALALPPSLTFNVVLFDREPEPLFPIPRSATLEALGTLEGSIGLGSLRNGTDLPLALRRAAQLHTADPSSGPAYWVVITDGALPDHDSPEKVGDPVGRLRADELQAAVLILRADGDDPTTPAARRALAELPARLGGVLRELPASGAVGAAGAIVEALRGRGDVINPLISGRGLQRSAPLQPLSIPPGSGARVVVKTSEVPAALRVRGLHGGAVVSASANVVALGRSWARALSRPPPPAWVKLDREAAIVIAPPPQPPDELPLVRGGMEKDVVQKALGYAFLPRARACYLTRKITTASDFQLRGRLRLEMHLERGEMMEAAVRRSTLGRPDIESCLRDAAFAVDVPRALNSDAPVIAAVNLVFRPRTEVKTPDAGAGETVDRELTRILGPTPPPSDPLELLIEDSAVTPAP